MSSLQIRSVLVASDLGAGSDLLVRSAGEIAAATGAELHAVHAFRFPPLSTRVADTFQAQVANATEALRAQMGRASPAGARPGAQRVSLLSPDRAILERAREIAADLVVLGPHGEHRTEHRLFGTTADQVIRAVEVPCLIVRSPLLLPLSRIVVPMDLSDASETALEQALVWASALGSGSAPAEVHGVHVLSHSPEAVGFLDAELRLGEEDELLGTLKRRMASASARLDDPGAVRIRLATRGGGAVARTLVDYAAETRADLVILGTRARGAIQRALLGSVASTVTREAGCSVLLLPPPMWGRPHPLRRSESEPGTVRTSGSAPLSA